MYKLKTIPTTVVERTEVDCVLCDICGEDTARDNDCYETSVVNINAKIGAVYPEGDCRTGHIIDVCPTCFLEKVKPLIESTFNIEFREVDVEMNRYEDFDK